MTTTTMETLTDLVRRARKEDTYYGPATGAVLVRLLEEGYPLERIMHLVGDDGHALEEMSREITRAIVHAGGSVRWQVGGESWDGRGPVLDDPMSEAEIREWLDDASRRGWDVTDRTIWVDNWAAPIDVVTEEPLDIEFSITVQIDPPEPECAESHEHDWQSPYEVLGGLRENPGVRGNGGGVICREVCAHCGRYQITDSWAQRHDDGTQGHTTVTHEDADDASLEWVAGQARDKSDV